MSGDTRAETPSEEVGCRGGMHIRWRMSVSSPHAATLGLRINRRLLIGTRNVWETVHTRDSGMLNRSKRWQAVATSHVGSWVGGLDGHLASGRHTCSATNASFTGGGETDVPEMRLLEPWGYRH